MIVFISFYEYNNNLLYLILYGYFHSIFHIRHKNWEIREYDTFSCDILDLHAIHMLKYRTRKKFDWAGGREAEVCQCQRRFQRKW